MNGRIKELAVQSGAGEWGDSVVPAMMDIEKFAQSIVNECLSIMQNCDGDLYFAIWKIKQDFGV